MPLKNGSRGVTYLKKEVKRPIKHMHKVKPWAQLWGVISAYTPFLDK